MKTLTLLCGLLALAACTDTPPPTGTPPNTQPPVSCDDGGYCKPDERPR